MLCGKPIGPAVSTRTTSNITNPCSPADSQQAYRSVTLYCFFSDFTPASAYMQALDGSPNQNHELCPNESMRHFHLRRHGQEHHWTINEVSQWPNWNSIEQEEGRCYMAFPLFVRRASWAAECSGAKSCSTSDLFVVRLYKGGIVFTCLQSYTLLPALYFLKLVTDNLG